MLLVNTPWSFPHSWLISGFVTRLTRQVSLVQQELLTLPDHRGSPPVFSGVRVTRSFVLCVCFVDSCLSFCPYSFCHSVALRILINSLISSYSLYFLLVLIYAYLCPTRFLCRLTGSPRVWILKQYLFGIPEFTTGLLWDFCFHVLCFLCSVL